MRNEFEKVENSPDIVLEDKMLAAAYQWHNYGKSTIGSRSDIERVPIENLRAFYQRYYQPDNAILIVAGKFDETRALAAGGQVLRRHPAPRAQARAHLDRRAGAGRRAPGHAPPRPATWPSCRSSTTASRAPTRTRWPRTPSSTS